MFSFSFPPGFPLEQSWACRSAPTSPHLKEKKENFCVSLVTFVLSGAWVSLVGCVLTWEDFLLIVAQVKLSRKSRLIFPWRMSRHLRQFWWFRKCDKHVWFSCWVSKQNKCCGGISTAECDERSDNSRGCEKKEDRSTLGSRCSKSW